MIRDVRYKQIILSRAVIDTQDLDFSETLVISGDSDKKLSDFSKSDQLFLNVPEKKFLWKGSEKESFEESLEFDGFFGVIPEKFTKKIGIFRVICPLTKEILEPEKLEAELESRYPTQDVIVAAWPGSSMGIRRRSGKWSQFVPIGGRIAILVSTENLKSDMGVLFSEFREDLKSGNILECLALSLSEHPKSEQFTSLEISGASIEEAIFAVIARKAFGAHNVKFYASKEIEPGWKRLVQHLGGKLNYQLDGSAVQKILELKNYLPAFDQDLALKQINCHSQVVPENLIKIFREK